MSSGPIHTADSDRQWTNAVAVPGRQQAWLAADRGITPIPYEGDDEMTDNERAASDEPMVADPEKAGAIEQTGGSGTGTQGSSNIAGQKDTCSGRSGQGMPGASGREGSSR